MAQDGLETFVTDGAEGGKDKNIATRKSVDDGGPRNNGAIPDGDEAVDVAQEYTQESFWLSKDAEYDWFDRNAFNYDPRESTKGNTSSTNINPSSNHSSSQRFHANLKAKASIIGLPKTQKAAFVDTKRRTCKPTNIRLFPKRSHLSAGKSTVPVAEPGSPKVSCMGRVRSKRGRRRLSNSIRRSENPGEKAKNDGEKRKTSFCAWLVKMFRPKKGHRKTDHSESRKVMEEEPAVVPGPSRKSLSMKVLDIRVSIESVAAQPPGLGGMKRFSSGRRSGSWTAEDLNQAVSVSLKSKAERGSHE